MVICRRFDKYETLLHLRVSNHTSKNERKFEAIKDHHYCDIVIIVNITTTYNLVFPLLWAGYRKIGPVA